VDRANERASAASQEPARIQAVPVPHPGRWLAALVVFVIAAMFVHSLITNPNFGWSTVGQYLFHPAVLAGLRNTVILTAMAMIIGISGGLLLAVMRLSPNPLLVVAASAYVWLFRGTPVITQLIFWNFLAALYPALSLGIPFGPQFVTVDTNTLISVFGAALLGLGLNEAAYMAEIIRGGILSVDEGQSEAAAALGMTRAVTLRRIVLPQALRVIVPPTGNEAISMLKTTSLVIVIAYYELMVSVQQIYARTFQTIPMLIVAAIWYLALTSALTVVQSRIEKRVGRGTRRFFQRRDEVAK
jgi:polar amino acid transport system permease protein